MALIGVERPTVLDYSNSGTTVTYSNPTVIGKATNIDLSLNGGSENILYGDNGPAESDNQFAGGTLGVGTTELEAAIMADLLGITPVSSEAVSGGKFINFDDDAVAPYKGFFAIRKHQVNGAIKYSGVYYDKIQFQNVQQALETQGETINWQTPTIDATLLRSDSTKHGWGGMTSLMDSVDDVIDMCYEHFGYTPPTPGPTGGQV